MRRQIFGGGNAILPIRQSTANQELATLMETISELKQKLAQLEAWNTEKNRYKKVELAQGAIAYALKEGMESGEPLRATNQHRC